jgi:PAS domain S-box-containing protein
MDIDLAIESENHVRLRNSLHSYLFENKEDNSLHCHHYACTLGKWLYEKGLTSYSHIPEIHQLERVHANLHECIIELLNKNQKEKLTQSYDLYNDLETLSKELSVLISSVNKTISSTAQITKTDSSITLCDHSEQLRNAMHEMNADLMREHQTLFDFFMQAPGMFCVLKGPTHVFQLVNPFYKQIIGNRELKGKDIRTALPELQGQGVFELLDRVYQRQKVFTGNEIPIYFNKGNATPEKAYVNFIYKPIINRNKETTGILVFGYDVSEQVYLRKQSEESETRLKLAMDAAEMGSFEWNMNTREFIYSDRLAKIFGRPKKKKITHKMFVDAIHPDDKKIRINAIEESLRTGILFYEARIIRPDRHVRWIKFSGRIIFDRKHNPQKMYGTAQDVTDQKTLEERLERSVKERTKELILKNELLSKQKELSDCVINSSIDSIAVLDTKLRFVILNEHAIKAYKKKPERIIGQQIHKIFPQIIKSGLYQDLKKAVAGEVVHNFNYRSPILKGYFETSILPLRDSNNVVFSILLISHDNTSIVEASERLITANKKLEEKNSVLERNNKELEAFRYIANHDLQEPLRKIQVFSGLIKKNSNDPDLVNEYVDNIKSSSRAMSDLVQAVLDFSRLSKNEGTYTTVKLDGVIKHALHSLQPLIAEKNALVKHEKLLAVNGNEEQLTQLFSCLIANGLKFSNKRPVVSISSKIIVTNTGKMNAKVNKYLELIFKDNGIGFEQKYADQIFKMFKRLQTSKLYPGAGIGLAMVKRIVDNHNGQIFVKSEPNKGTTFYIYLPIAEEL